MDTAGKGERIIETLRVLQMGLSPVRCELKENALDLLGLYLLSGSDFHRLLSKWTFPWRMWIPRPTSKRQTSQRNERSLDWVQCLEQGGIFGEDLERKTTMVVVRGSTILSPAAC